MKRSHLRAWVVACGVGTLFYASAVVLYVSTSPDLRVRILAFDEAAGDGVGVVATPGVRAAGDAGEAPRVGDRVVRLAGRPVETAIDFYDAFDGLLALRSGGGTAFSPVRRSDGPAMWAEFVPNPLVQDETGVKYVRARLLDRADGRERTVYLAVQSVPASGLALTLIWLAPHLVLTFVGGLAFWSRPFDRSARLFLLMSLAMLGTFAAGFHWWVLAHNTWLLLPFVGFGTALPALCLHFFLAYPRVRPSLADRPRLVLAAVYGPAAAAGLLVLVGLAAAVWVASPWGAADADAKRHLLYWLGGAVNGFLLVVAGYHVATVATIAWNLRHAATPLERNQLRWIAAAAAVSAVPVAYVFWLAWSDRAAFAYERGRLPVVLACLAFLAAYAVAMVRHRLLLVDEILDKGTRYYLVHAGLTAAVAVALASLAGLEGLFGVALSPARSVALRFAVLAPAVGLLLWLRDGVRREVDRRFYREKYRLDRVLRDLGADDADGEPGLADPRNGEAGGVRGRLMDTCREALGAERGGLYAADGDGRLRRVAAFGEPPLPAELPAAAVRGRDADGAHAFPPDDRPGRTDLVDAPPAARVPGAVLVHRLAAADGGGSVLLLGPKRGGETYSAEDLTFLDALGRMAAAWGRAERVRRLWLRARDELRSRDEACESLRRQVAALQSELAATLGGSADPVGKTPGDFDRGELRGRGPALAGVLETAKKVADSDAVVLIRGESGTGKELLAHALHRNGPRAAGPFVPVHCAALSATLLEGELFGHVRGAFTGADRDRAGRFEQADGGTLFLDELGEIPPEVQVKLLRVLQERTVQRVGGDELIPVDVRVVSATHRDLEAMIADGTFREDLYYRLNVVALTLPPLRDRREDLVELAYGFLHAAARRQGRSISRIDDDALAVLGRHDFPGNVRELKNLIERAVVLAEGDALTLADLPADLAPLRPPGTRRTARRPSAPPAAPPAPSRTPSSLPAPAEAAGPSDDSDGGEREELVAALDASDGNKSRAARSLGMPRSTFFSKLKKHGVV